MKRVLTNFPEPSTKFLVVVEHSCELVAVVQNAHQAEQVLGRDGVVNFIVAEQIVCGLDKEKLQDTLDDDLSEDTTSLV